MDLRLKPGLAAKIDQWSAQTGRPACDLVEDAVAAYFNELGELRATLDSRYDGVASGRVQLVDGQDARTLLKKRASARRRSIA